MATPSLPVRAAALAPLQAVLAGDALVLRLGARERPDDLLPLCHPEAGAHFRRGRPVGPHPAPRTREGLLPNTPPPGRPQSPQVPARRRAGAVLRSRRRAFRSRPGLPRRSGGQPNPGRPARLASLPPACFGPFQQRPSSR